MPRENRNLAGDAQRETLQLFMQILAAQKRTNELLAELLKCFQKQQDAPAQIKGPTKK